MRNAPASFHVLRTISSATGDTHARGLARDGPSAQSPSQASARAAEKRAGSPGDDTPGQGLKSPPRQGADRRLWDRRHTDKWPRRAAHARALCFPVACRGLVLCCPQNTWSLAITTMGQGRRQVIIKPWGRKKLLKLLDRPLRRPKQKFIWISASERDHIWEAPDHNAFLSSAYYSGTSVRRGVRQASHVTHTRHVTCPPSASAWKVTNLEER